MRISDWISDVCSSDLGSAIFLVIEAVPRFFAPHPVSHSGIGMAVMAFSIVATVALVALQRHVIRSEEHTSELQSLMRISYAVFCLKKKKQIQQRSDIRSNST